MFSFHWTTQLQLRRPFDPPICLNSWLRIADPNRAVGPFAGCTDGPRQIFWAIKKGGGHWKVEKLYYAEEREKIPTWLTERLGPRVVGALAFRCYLQCVMVSNRSMKQLKLRGRYLVITRSKMLKSQRWFVWRKK